MKQRSMLKVFTLAFIISIANVFLGCSSYGISSPIVESCILEFDSASIKCKKISYGAVVSGNSMTEGDELRFIAILPSGKIVENWYINGKKQENQTSSIMVYTVKSSDFVDGKIKISVVFKQPESGTIKFNSASIKCKTDSYPIDEVVNGSPIKEGDGLKFEAILPSGKIVENWYINGKKQENQTSSEMGYIVKASDFDGGKIKITVVLKQAGIGTIEYDSASIKCKTFSPYVEVVSGSSIKKGDGLIFDAIPPSEDKYVENWYINDIKQENQTSSTMYYTVKPSDFDGEKIKISVVFH